MYNYIFYNKGLPVTIVIRAENKKQALIILKEFGNISEWSFEERTKN